MLVAAAVALDPQGAVLQQAALGVVLELLAHEDRQMTTGCLDRLQEALEQRLPQVEINRYAKPTFSKPAPDALRKEIRDANDFVVIGLAD